MWFESQTIVSSKLINFSVINRFHKIVFDVLSKTANLEKPLDFELQ